MAYSNCSTKVSVLGHSLLVQGLGLCISTAEGTGLVPVLGPSPWGANRLSHRLGILVRVSSVEETRPLGCREDLWDRQRAAEAETYP